MASGSPSVNSRALRRAVEREINAIATDILAEAKRQVPRDKNTLRKSGTKEVGWQGDRVTATISFNTPYALVQHEDRSFQHPRGGKAKYLEDPLRAAVPDMKRRLDAAYRRALG
jgi:hypothetical protein